MDLESLLTDPRGFQLEKATRVQRAIARVISGDPLGELREDEDVRRVFGGKVPADGSKPLEIIICSGIRGGKTLLAAAVAVWIARTADLDDLGAGEIPRISILSTEKKQAQACLNHLKGNLQASPVMRKWMVGEPTAESIMLRHPSGRLVEIVVVAGSRAGSTLVAVWMLAVIFDEAPRIAGDEANVVNIKECRRAVLGRMRGPILYVGSPWAPVGFIYEQVAEHFGNPTENVVVVRARGPDMNPQWWTPARCERLRAQDETAYQTDVEANFADIEEQFYQTVAVERCMMGRTAIPEVPRDGHHYSAAMDPATRSNAWTLVVNEHSGFDESGAPIHRIVLARQWKGRPGDALRPKAILREIAETLRPYDVDTVHSDQWSADAIADLAEEVGLDVAETTVTATSKYEAAKNLQTLINEQRISLPSDPMLKKDLQLTRKTINRNGLGINYTKTADGRHCDYTPALILVVAALPDAPEQHVFEGDPMAQARKRRIEQLENGDVWQDIADRFMGVA